MERRYEARKQSILQEAEIKPNIYKGDISIWDTHYLGKTTN